MNDYENLSGTRNRLHLFCISIAIAVLSTGLRDDYYSDPEEDEEQAKYIREWIKKNER